jgi:DNA-binding LacI/PurR family transcriptional regulator
LDRSTSNKVAGLSPGCQVLHSKHFDSEDAQEGLHVATIYDVAEAAGVSISTVSLAMNNPSRVRGSTLTRVMEAVDQVGFVPKTDAVIRARKGVGRVGVIAPFTSFASFFQRLRGVVRTAKKEGFEVVLYDEESAAETRLASLPITRRVDGLIVMSLPLSDAVASRLVEQGVPTVLIELGRQGFSSITHDDVAGGRLVGDLLLRHGHERFGYIGHAQAVSYVSQSQMRLEGFASRLPEPPEVRLVEHSSAAAYEAALEMLSLNNRPTGLFAYSDVMAGGVLRAARELGLAVPDEVAVVGFDDSDLAEALGLSTIHQPLEESGQVAMETLLAQLANPQAGARQIELALSLVERETTAPLRSAAAADGRHRLQQEPSGRRGAKAHSRSRAHN